MPVSQMLSTAILAEHHGTSVRWQVRRLVIACQLEQRYGDAQMFRAWLATASFGLTSHGADAAAQTLFSKPANALNAEESAKLAALLRRPGLRTQPDKWAQAAQAVIQRVNAAH